MASFLDKLSRNCQKLQALDLSDAEIGGNQTSIDALASMTQLRVLKLDRCDLDTADALQIMSRNRSLFCFECDDKLQAVASMARYG